jgi:Protein of unknown function (DUF3485)
MTVDALAVVQKNHVLDDGSVEPADEAIQGIPANCRLIRKPSAKPEWIWIISFCVVVGSSGGYRYSRDRKFQSLNQESEKAPFPLNEFPKVLGNWHEVEGTETALDPEVARIAGSSDHVIRTYVNVNNGERAEVMILYGLATLVWPHTPNACYPAAGFKSVPPSREVEIDVPESTATARFREENFAKYKTGAGIYQQVYYSFRNADEWGLNMENRWKSFRYHPGMFKIQVQRQVAAIGKSDNGSLEQFLGSIVHEIEQRLAVKM